MADLNYVSPLTSDLTDYYTKTEVDELQQGDAATYATTAQVDSKDNAVKNWVENKGYLTQHQSLANYATKNYVDEAVAGIEVGGVSIEVVNALPSIQNAQENVIYLVLSDDSNTGNIYDEWIYVPAAEDFEMIGNTAEGVIPDLTNYATKNYVDIAVAGISIDAKDVSYDNDASGLEASNVKNAIDEVYAAIPVVPVLATVATSGDYDDLSNKPTIPSLTGYATTTYVDDAVSAVVVPDISGLATEQYVDDAVAAIDIPDVSGFVESSDLATVATSGSYNDLTDKPTIPAAPDLSSYATKSELSAKANAADLATVATSGSYNDLSNKPTIPSTSGLASETYVDNAIAAINIPDVSDFITAEDLPDLSGYAETANLATVATSGSYNDLSNKPTIPDISSIPAENIRYNYPDLYPFYVNDVKQYLDMIIPGLRAKANTSSLATVATSGDYDDLTNKPTIPSITGLATETYVDNAVAGISVPANTSDLTNDSGFITSADLPDTSGFVESSDLATVATTGDYDDLTNKPTIPVLPTLATVATSGSYNDLSDKPTIPASAGIEGTADGGLAFIYPELLDNSARKGYVLGSNTTQDELIEWLKSGYWIRLMNKSIQDAIPIGSFGNYNRVFIYTLNKDTGVITSQYYQSGTLSFSGNGWVVRVLPNAFLCIPCTNTSTQDTETLNAIKKMRENYLLNYDNTTSGLSATTIQGAIDELAAASGGGSEVGWSYDSSTGYMTFTGMNDESL